MYTLCGVFFNNNNNNNNNKKGARRAEERKKERKKKKTKMTKHDFHRFQVRHFSNNFEQSPCYCKMGQRQRADLSVF